MRLFEVIKIKITGCNKCFSVTYTLPCDLTKDVADYFTSFGKPIYNLKSVKLLKIESTDKFNIEGKIGTKVIKLTIPKELEKLGLAKIPRKIEFEKCLADYLTDTLHIEINL